MSAVNQTKMTSGMMSNHMVPIFVSADPALGAFNLTSGNDRFSVQFKKQINIPSEAQNITLECNRATIWWTVLNIEANINDQFQLEVNGDAVYTITVPPGLYDFNALNSSINSLLINEGLASGLISITGDSATQKILLSFSTANLQVQWIAGSMFELLGFNLSQNVPTAGFTTDVYSELAPNIANFSDISSFLLHTNLVQAGMPLGDLQSQAIAQAQIDVPPGSQINFNPFNPLQFNVGHLRGQSILQADFWLTDQLSRGNLDFNGEYFTMLIIIRYHLHSAGITHI